MDKILFLVLLSAALVMSQSQDCNMETLITCINTFSTNVLVSDGNDTALCSVHNVFRECVRAMAKCAEDQFVPNTERQLGKNFTEICGRVTTHVPRPTTLPPSVSKSTMDPAGCNVYDINKCSSTMMDAITVAADDTQQICRAAHIALVCLNALMSCVDQREFTQALDEMENRLDLFKLCPMLQLFPVRSSAVTISSAHVLSILSISLGYIMA